MHSVPVAKAQDERCLMCNGSGFWGITTGTKCFHCDGKGMARPSDVGRPFDVENVQEFITFLRGCGGFEIL